MFFYEQILKVTVYVIFASEDGLLEFYQLENEGYQLKQPNENRYYWLDSMGLFLGIWQGTKEGRTGYWLRCWNQDGHLLLWAVEQIEKERQEKQKRYRS
jgi:hypothetical protein